MTPGRLLRAARQRHGLSQQRLARRAGTTQSAISRIERDQLSPTVETLATLLRVMGDKLEIVAQPFDYGHDRTLLQRTTQESPSTRVQRGIDFANFVIRNRGTARRSARDA